jgi:DNA-directed RNA polymerase subunit omega
MSGISFFLVTRYASRFLLLTGAISDIINYLLEATVQPLNGIDSKFRLAILVARRAKQLIGGARKKVEVKSDNMLTVAMEEFRQGKIDFDVLNEEDNFFSQGAENMAGTAVTAEVGLEGEEADSEADLDAEEPEKEAEPESES